MTDSRPVGSLFDVPSQQIQQALMVQRVEVLAEVETDRIAVSFLCVLLHSTYGIFCTSSRPVAVASVRELWLIDGHELLTDGLLDDSVDDGRNTKLSYSAVRLRDLDSPHRRRGVFAP